MEERVDDVPVRAGLDHRVVDPAREVVDVRVVADRDQAGATLGDVVALVEVVPVVGGDPVAVVVDGGDVVGERIGAVGVLVVDRRPPQRHLFVRLGESAGHRGEREQEERTAKRGREARRHRGFLSRPPGRVALMAPGIAAVRCLPAAGNGRHVKEALRVPR
jgi:hypothetical protein